VGLLTLLFKAAVDFVFPINTYSFVDG